METLSEYNPKTDAIESVNGAVSITWSSDTGYKIETLRALDWVAVKWIHILSGYEWNLTIGN